MTSYPTICRVCGGKIEKPAPERHMCEDCEDSNGGICDACGEYRPRLKTIFAAPISGASICEI